MKREQVGSGRVGAARRCAAHGKDVPVLAVIGLVPERKTSIPPLVLGVPQEPRGDAGLREHLVVHVVVVVAARGLLDHGAEQEISGVAVGERLSRYRARRDAGVDRADQVRQRFEAVAHAGIPRVVQIVPGARGMTEKHGDRDLIADRFRI